MTLEASRPGPLSRRRFLALTAGLAAAAPLAAACTSASESAGPDPLVALATRARADADLARAVANTHPDLAAAAGVVAADRTAHAEALEREVRRVQPEGAPAPSGTASAAPGAPASPTAAETGLVEALRAAEKEAKDVVVAVPRYRAGLVGSVAASCASLREVLA
ncbi:hypothetical protein GCM10012275_06850 [Longimycelium tulufanense]|uniref:Uncharacterized protein n=1 Tax=Longimycelium tulufanense TaxID=907463 RepID=A0A8J3CAB4_9PSEU|nr:hypothetical protein [Longimycelium tulufanense]GGM38518.1 hypothetical protein GCM10012275_06850 [Longimycelium tulufanense]